jgi:plastocyanin
MKRVHLGIAAALAALVVTALPAQAAPAAPIKLRGVVGPGFTITLTKAGKKVKTLKHGKYVLTVYDKSGSHNFHLKGPGVNKYTSVGAMVTKTWKITLKAGKYTYVCDPHKSVMKGSFRVT